jgi:hypothetical protein
MGATVVVSTWLALPQNPRPDYLLAAQPMDWQGIMGP